jgi:hypothetical protein
MNLAQIIEALPLQVYVRRGELVIHFSTPVDLVNRVAETSAALSDFDRSADPSRTDGKTDRAGRRGSGRPVAVAGTRSEVDAVGVSANHPEQPAHSG